MRTHVFQVFLELTQFQFASAHAGGNTWESYDKCKPVGFKLLLEHCHGYTLELSIKKTFRGLGADRVSSRISWILVV
jgi:hypothetical protein